MGESFGAVIMWMLMRMEIGDGDDQTLGESPCIAVNDG
jgi:hypothetical protein